MKKVSCEAWIGSLDVAILSSILSDQVGARVTRTGDA